MKSLGDKLEKNVKSEYHESLTLLKIIPDIRDKTTLMLLVFTDVFHLSSLLYIGFIFLY
jgi:hypothetical protein